MEKTQGMMFYLVDFLKNNPFINFFIKKGKKIINNSFFNLNNMPFGEISGYNLTKFRQNRIKNKKILLIGHFL